MTAQSLFEECHGFIERGHELWKSYFSKWETLAKREEDVPESELLPEPNNRMKTTKKQTQSKILRSKKNHKKVIKKKRIPKKHKTKQKTDKQIKEECLVDDTDNEQLETVLKSVLKNILNANRKQFQMFAVLSHTISQGDSSVFNSQQIKQLQFNNGLSLTNTISFGRSVCPPRNTVLERLAALPEAAPSGLGRHQAVELEFNNGFSLTNAVSFRGLLNRSVSPRSMILESPPGGSFGICLAEDRQFGGLNGCYPKFHSNFGNDFGQQRFLLPLDGAQTPEQTTRINFGICSPENTQLKPLEWDFSHKSPNRVCRKINKEYFIKRSFPEMNITQDGKRFRSLCLRKRTNSVSLSMENSNFITPERNPSERKCFSENVLQRKRRRPSKVFFDNEVEDSESDDQTENRAPLIHCKNKTLKRRLVQGGVESDSDDCETIFDGVRA